MRHAPLLIIVFCAAAQPRYDLLLKGGHVIDPRNNLSAVRDVAVAQGRIASIDQNIPASQARTAIDVSSLYITPGLIDMHVHVFADSMNPMASPFAAE